MIKVEYLPIAEITPYAGNAKMHPKEQIEQIKRSIEEFGFNDPLGLWHGEIVEGHGRYLAAKEMGMTELPVIKLDDLTDEQRRAYGLVHNKLTMNSDFNLDLLDMELTSISAINMDEFGFDIIAEEPKEIVEDEYKPEIPQCPKAKAGDIYQLGRHRLMCGDSTRQEDVEKLMAGDVADMVCTDPPYNVDYEGTAGKIKNDKMKCDEFRNFLTSAFSNIRRYLKRGGAFHIWFADSEGYNFRGACADAGLTVRQQLVWVKNSATIGRQDFQHMYESVLTGEALPEEEGGGFLPCLYGWNEGAAHKWYKKRKEKDVMFFNRPLASKEHPTMKPVLLFDYEMKCNTKPGEIVLDLFGGSGTTIIAAEQNGRQALVMEYDPKFVDVIIDRWEKFTGKKAVLLNG